MKRAILMALGTAAVITSAAALGIGMTVRGATAAAGATESERALASANAREAQRAMIDARYLGAREKCSALGGYARDQCLIGAHAARGRALLDAQAPYEMRN